MGITGALSRYFLLHANITEVHGLDGFLGLLDSRSNVLDRQRGLITGQSAYTHTISGEELKGDPMRSVEPY
jgi:hypothetical protein